MPPQKQEEDGRRPAIERMGLFTEAGYLRQSPPIVTRSDKEKGRQFTTAPAKEDTYFSQTYARAFQGEAYTDLVAIRRKERREQSKKNLVPAGFKPSSVPPMASGKGSIYGTIAQQFPLHDRPDPPAPPPEPPHSRAPPLRNFYTRPAKKGGYGYLEPGTIGAPFEYMPSPYDREHELEVEAAEKSKKKCVGKAFVGSSHEAPFFQAPLCISSPFTLGAKEHLEQPDKPWRPTSSAQPYLSSFPEYAPPNPQPSRTDMEAAIRDAVAARKAAAADASSGRFRPVGSSCHSYPMTSIIEMNVPKAPSMRVRGMISALRDRATSK